MFLDPYRLERVKRQFGKKQDIYPECKFVFKKGRYRACDPNLFDTPPRWEHEWNPPKDYGSGSNTNNEGVKALDKSQFK